MAAPRSDQTSQQFRAMVFDYFEHKGIGLKRGLTLNIGAASFKRPHVFDFGSETHRLIIECKSNSWAKDGTVPRSKLMTYNAIMYYFLLAPVDFRKLLALRRVVRTGQTLGQYYVLHYRHLIPYGVELWEFEQDTGLGFCLYGPCCPEVVF